MMITLVVTFFAAACSEKKPKETDETEANQKEIQALDSVAVEVENVTQEIVESAEKLDALLEELEN